MPYSSRRARVAAALGVNAIAIVPTAPVQQRNRDCDFPYRHDSYFYYLSGFAEPNAWLVLTGDGRSVLFCQPKDAEREIWDGIRLGPEAAPTALGVDEAHPVDELDQRLPARLAALVVLDLGGLIHGRDIAAPDAAQRLRRAPARSHGQQGCQREFDERLHDGLPHG